MFSFGNNKGLSPFHVYQSSELINPLSDINDERIHFSPKQNNQIIIPEKYVLPERIELFPKHFGRKDLPDHLYQPLIIEKHNGFPPTVWTIIGQPPSNAQMISFQITQNSVAFLTKMTPFAQNSKIKYTSF